MSSEPGLEQSKRGRGSKRKRECFKEGLVATTVFAVGFTPYKVTLNLPHWGRYSRDVVAEAAAEQGVRQPPNLPPGYFNVLHSAESHQVALFKFASVTGCRSTDSNEHGKLPLPEKGTKI